MRVKGVLKDWVQVGMLVVAIIVLSVLLVSKGPQQQSDRETGNVDVVEPTNVVHQLAYSELIGEKVVVLDSLLGAGQAVDVLFISHPRDCGSCVQKGVDVVEQLVDLKFAGSIYYCFGGPDERYFQKSVPFAHQLFDARRVVSRSLRNIPTPALLFLAPDRSIKALYLPTIYDDSSEWGAFLSSVLRLDLPD